MRHLHKALFQGLILGLLTACGPLNDNNLGVKLAAATKELTGIGRSEAAPPTLAPEVANAAPGDVLLVRIVSRDAVAPLTKVAQSGDAITWISPGKVTMSFESGILVGTRGLGNDLMGADVDGVRAALNAGGGTAMRRHSFLTSEDQIFTREMTCTVTREGAETLQTLTGPRETTKLVEDCVGPLLSFKNSYWMAGGEIVRSRQAVSATEGFIQVDPL